MNDEKAFDAGESYLCEDDQEPSAKWRTVSLVTGIFRLVSQRPEAGREAAERRRGLIKAAAAQLTARGLDGVALVRYGMAQEVIAPVVSALILKLLSGEDSAIEGVDASAWCAALGIDHQPPLAEKPAIREIAGRFSEVILPAISRIRQWAGCSSLDEMISLAPPRPGELAATDAVSGGERGFCMIPVDPTAALEHLKTASNMEYRPTVTNSYNQMCCYWSLGRSRAALNVAAAEWSRVGSDSSTSAFLWRLTAREEWEIHEEGDPLGAVAALAAEIAHREGWQEQEEFWRANQAARSTSGSEAA